MTTILRQKGLCGILDNSGVKAKCTIVAVLGRATAPLSSR
jgi:hypothetical protein